jgi:cysteine desulfurase
MKRLYLDHAAGSPLRAGARAAMLPLLESANASSLHAPGRSARAAVDRARDTVARALDCLPREVVFTSSGTEANAAALLGLARACAGPKRLLRSAVEHSAVRAAAEALVEEAGWEVEELAVDGGGRVAPATLAAALERPASLVSVMLANNEIGTVQPVAELAAIAKTAGALFHCDAVQAPGSLPIEPAGYGIDAISLGASKFGGPQGCGILYLRSGVAFRPALAGSQEAGRRAGTENVAAIAGAAAALQEAEAGRAAEAARLSALRDRFEAEIARSIDDIAFPGQRAPRLPGISSVAFRGVEHEALLVGLDLAGVAVSTGSACAAGSVEPSHVLRAIGAPEWAVRGVIRFSFGHSTTEEDVTDVLRMLPSVVGSVRGFAPSEVST